MQIHELIIGMKRECEQSRTDLTRVALPFPAIIFLAKALEEEMPSLNLQSPEGFMFCGVKFVPEGK